MVVNRHIQFSSEGSGAPAQTYCPLIQSRVSADLHVFARVHNHVPCFKRRQRNCITVPLLKLCNHILSNTFDLLKKTKIALCEHVQTPMYLYILLGVAAYLFSLFVLKYPINMGDKPLHFLLSFGHISVLTCLWDFEIFSGVVLFDWVSTEMTIAIDRHVKHTYRLVTQSSTAATAVLLKFVFEASLDLHIEEQLHRICRCFLLFF